MARKRMSALECMRFEIEMAENGIIFRGGENADDVSIAKWTGEHKKDEKYGFDIDHSEEYRLIGKRIYDWLRDDVLNEHQDEFIITGFAVTLQAHAVGRDFDED